MKIESTDLLNRDDILSIHKRVFFDRAEISASIEAKRIGLIVLTKRDSDWKVESFYSDRTYDRTGRLINRLYNSMMNLSYQKELEPIEDSLSNNLTDILKYMEKD